MRYVGLVRNVMLGREGLDRDVLLRLVIGRREPVVVREAAWFRDLVASDPFAAFPGDQWERAVAFLPLGSAPLDPAAVPRIDGLEAVAVLPHELLMAGRRGVRRPGATYLLPRPWRDRATTRSWSTIQRLASPRTTSTGAMPSSAGRSKPQT
jgi:uncharacterized protein (DUF1697 family)